LLFNFLISQLDNILSCLKLLPVPLLLLIIAPPNVAIHTHVGMVPHEAQADIAGAVQTNNQGHVGEAITAHPHVIVTEVAQAGADIAATAVPQAIRVFQILFCISS
jgi:hypothetical protein